MRNNGTRIQTFSRDTFDTEKDRLLSSGFKAVDALTLTAPLKLNAPNMQDFALFRHETSHEQVMLTFEPWDFTDWEPWEPLQGAE